MIVYINFIKYGAKIKKELRRPALTGGNAYYMILELKPQTIRGIE